MPASASWNSRAALVLLLVAALAGCGSGSPTSALVKGSVTISVSPATSSVAVGGHTLAYTATISNATNAGFKWQVNGVDGGDGTYGTISASGLYVSPASLPTQAVVAITAVSAVDATQSGSADLTLTGSGSTVSVSVSPISATVVAGGGTQVFAATVQNSANQAVTWQVNGASGGNAAIGTISASGLYTAPATPPAQPTVTVTAVSVQDPTKSASAAVTISSVLPPSIGGTPATSVLVGQSYDFKPTASDPNGLALSFSASGAPAWTSFNKSTGELSGSPAAADVGTSTIIISATNGSASAHLTFTLSVVQAATGSAIVSWVAPTTRVDGTPLTNLAGFRVYYGTNAGSLATRLDVANATSTSAVVGGLTTGPWYFAVTAVDSAGGESSLSTVVSKTI